MITKQQPSTAKAPTSRRWVSVQGVPRLFKLAGVKKTSYVYKYADGRSETLSSALNDDSKALKQALVTARRQAFDIYEGRVLVGSVEELICRFIDEIAPMRYQDQSDNGKKSRQHNANKLIAVFGKMAPHDLKTIHGYQYLEHRARAGAPEAANKELSLLRVIMTQAVKWGVVDANPFLNMESNKTTSEVRNITRGQVTRFYLWSIHQDTSYRTMGAAAMFSFLTGFRATEVRGFKIGNMDEEGVYLPNAKRKKGEHQTIKLRRWSSKLRCVVARAKQRTNKTIYLFAPTKGTDPYTRSGWGAQWRKAWANYLQTDESNLNRHPEYFSLQDVRPASITEKLEIKSADKYEFAGHANPATTHRYYDRRRVNAADALD